VGLLDSLVPAGVACSEAFADDPADTLFPAEQDVVARAVAKRRNEFTGVRGCARRALAALGLPPAPILPGERGAPGWPAGVVGSMTHCDGYRGAALARQKQVRTIGIDAEPDAPLPDGVLAAIALEPEVQMLRRLAEDGGPHWDRLLFSAKESVYKAWFPLARSWLNFEEARVTFDPVAGTFQARLLVPGPVTGFSGTWLARRGLVITAIVVPATVDAVPLPAQRDSTGQPAAAEPSGARPAGRSDHE
jgi:4'-phosphopantetheinyl transferase EntD